MKQCKSCGNTHSLAAFSRHSGMRDGHLNYCKTCVYARSKNYRSRSPEGRAAEHRRRRIRLGLPEVPVKLTANECHNRHRIATRLWYRRKVGIPASAPVRDDQGRAPEYYRARHTALETKRLAAKRQRTPSWLNQAHFAEIEGAYLFAKVMERITGHKHHVDHIEPLQGRDINGLHVPWNLQVILAQENFRKGNRRI